MPKNERNAIWMALAAVAAAAFLVATTTTTPSAYAQTSQLTVNSQLSNGTVITGYYTEVISNSDASQSSGFTPAAFALNNGEEYRVGVADFLNFFFDYWLDTSSDNRWRDVTVTADTQLTAIYREESALQLAAAPAAPDSGVNFGYIEQMAKKISVYKGAIPDVNLSGYKLPDGSEIMECDSMYSLVNAGMNVSQVTRAAELAGLDWAGLSEAQQCYLVLVLNVNIPLDENGLPL